MKNCERCNAEFTYDAIRCHACRAQAGFMVHSEHPDFKRRFLERADAIKNERLKNQVVV